MKEKAAKAFQARKDKQRNLQFLIYGNEDDYQEEEVEDSSEILGELFRKVKKQENAQAEKRSWDGVDSTRCTFTEEDALLKNEEILGLVKNCFVTGKWKDGEDAQTLLDKDEEIYGDFEDLEEKKDEDTTPEKEEEVHQEAESGGRSKKLSREEREAQIEAKRQERKRKLKEAFNTDYDHDDEKTYYDELKQELGEQAQVNQKEFEDLDDERRVQFEGYRAGLYLRVEMQKMPCELVEHFNASYPVILGGLLAGEGRMGYCQASLLCPFFHLLFYRPMTVNDLSITARF